MVIAYRVGAALLALCGAFAAGMHYEGTQWESKWHERDAQEIALARDTETKWQQRIEEIRNESKQTLEDIVQRERAAADGRLRSAVKAAKQRAVASPSATCGSQTAAVEVFAELLTGADELAEKFAAEADRARASGLACEAAYDAIANKE